MKVLVYSIPPKRVTPCHWLRYTLILLVTISLSIVFIIQVYSHAKPLPRVPQLPRCPSLSQEVLQRVPTSWCARVFQNLHCSPQATELYWEYSLVVIYTFFFKSSEVILFSSNFFQLQFEKSLVWRIQYSVSRK